MAKGDDAIRRKKTKLNRKKMSKESSTVSARVAAIIAAKQRRKSGKRRMCEGMCFSLPTPEDPFNDRTGKKTSKGKKMNRDKVEKLISSQVDGEMFLKSKGALSGGRTLSRNLENVQHEELKRKKFSNWKNEQSNCLKSCSNVGKPLSIETRTPKVQPLEQDGVIPFQQGGHHKYSDRPSKFLILCLNAIQNALFHDCTANGDMEKSLLVNRWGVEFWNCYSIGSDILETTGACSTIEQIAWMVSTAADTIARKEKEGQYIASPFLLFLVSSQEKATMVRSVCKPLKALGIHTVSLHAGTPLEHQICGLKSCEPEFLVSTPDRLLELVSLKAIDISEVSLLVVDDLQTSAQDGFLDKMKFIRHSISGNLHTIIFHSCIDHASTSVVQYLLSGTVCRFSLSDSVTSQSACITQKIHLCASEEEKISKVVQVLYQEYGNQPSHRHSKVLSIVRKDEKNEALISALRATGYSISSYSISNSSEEMDSSCSEGRPIVSLMDVEQANRIANIGQFEVVIIFDFVASTEDYVGILTRMARHTVNGILHSCFSNKDALLAGSLIHILEQCGQTIPEALRNLCGSMLSNFEH